MYSWSARGLIYEDEEQVGRGSAAEKDMGISQGPAAEWGRSCGLRYAAHSRGHRHLYMIGYPKGYPDIRQDFGRKMTSALESAPAGGYPLALVGIRQGITDIRDGLSATISSTVNDQTDLIYIKPASKLYDQICEAYEKNTRARRLMLEDAFWTAKHDPNVPIAKWIARVRSAASDLTSVKLTPHNQQICDRLLRGLDDSWKPIRDHLVYSPNEVSLDDAIGALESHEVSTQVPTDHYDASAATTKAKPRLGCWNCGQKGHHSSKCPNPSLKKKSGAQASSAEARSLICDPWQLLRR
ncbi:uncharacterized protein PGTG_04299 [Puccinia graminis f. sp. tritici CRL 75-36-700-3]|uniref:CCHC-type domain-containing protein n=1 Tax=Puccinia graminis f. sp. tritici (strain CRL 75-36-700-3 / race SCCL) TaxID=418459 RepID=E3K1X4_PUCGT|nr:uncharacterized protein PGTG_04299 [Puccinia graminis f. sp. tritici CRL 75-36-700-3]EFP78343.1 hypothetical protein PGTG_04299 [Puccinia graminis f. sp. tritici CRL 75-36-700-3]